MKLRKTLRQFPIGKWSSIFDPKAAPAATLTDLVNARCERALVGGGLEVQKRGGWRYIRTSGGSNGIGTAVPAGAPAARERLILVPTADRVRSYELDATENLVKSSEYPYSTGDINQGVRCDFLPAVTPIGTGDYLLTADGDQRSCDVFLHSTGHALYVYEDSVVGCVLSVRRDGAPSVQQELQIASNEICPRVVVANGRVVVFTVLGTTLRWRDRQAANWDISNPLSISTALTVTGATASTVYDVAVINGTLYIAVSDGGTNVRVHTLNPSTGTLSAATVVACDGRTAITWLTHDGANGSVYFACVNQAQTQITIATLPAAIGSSTVDTITTAFNTVRNVVGAVTATGEKFVYYESALDGATIDSTVRRIYRSAAGGVTIAGDSLVRHSVGLASKMQKVTLGGTTFYATMLSYSSPFQSSYFLVVDRYGAVPTIAARTLPTIAGGQSERRGHLPRLEVASASRLITAGLWRTTPNTPASFGLRSVVQLGFDAADPRRGRPVEAAGTLYFPGGVVRGYDGVGLAETGFLVGAEQAAITLAEVVGTGSVAPGTYNYTFIFTSIDATGRKARSSVAVPKSITTANPGSSVRATISGLRLHARATVRVEVYRTITGPGTVYYKCAESDVVGNLDSGTTIGGQTSQVSDLRSDAQLQIGELLYTQPGSGVKENEAPPPSIALALHRGRLWAISADDGSIWYSKEVKEGQGIAFSSDFRIPAREGDPYTALVSIDSHLVAFRQRGADVITGDGPNDLGQPALYAQPQPLPLTLGVVNSRLVAPTPRGCVFVDASGAGIWQLDRGLAESYIGAPVDAYRNSTFIDVIARGTEVFLFTNTTTILMYDGKLDYWARDTVPAWSTPVAGFLRGTDVCFCDANGMILRYQPGTYSDQVGSTYGIAMSAVVTLPLAGFAGLARIFHGFVIGEYAGPHTLTVRADYDATGTRFEDWTENMGTLVADPEWDGSYRVRLQPDELTPRQTIARLTVSDGGAQNATLKLTGIAFVLGMVPGAPRLPGAHDMTP